MTPWKSGDPERRRKADTAMQSFRIPAMVLITAMVLSLLGIAAWSLDLERRKVDKTAVETIQNDIKEIQRDVKELLRRDGRRPGYRPD